MSDVSNGFAGTCTCFSKTIKHTNKRFIKLHQCADLPLAGHAAAKACPAELARQPPMPPQDLSMVCNGRSGQGHGRNATDLLTILTASCKFYYLSLKWVSNASP